jgi:hypothetical protein
MRDQIPYPDDLDLLLDSALSTYADPGPDFGLEGRVLTALSAARDSDGRKIAAAKPRRQWLPWAIASPVAAGLILVWVIASTRVVHAPTQAQQAHPSEEATSESPSVPLDRPAPTIPRKMHPSGAKAPVHSGASAARLKSCPVTELALAEGVGQVSEPCRETVASAANLAHAATAPLPKLDVFPTPQPLTEQEQAFLFYAQQAPTAQLQALSEAQARDEDPFPVATVHIPALEPPTQGTN